MANVFAEAASVLYHALPDDIFRVKGQAAEVDKNSKGGQLLFLFIDILLLTSNPNRQWLEPESILHELTAS